MPNASDIDDAYGISAHHLVSLELRGGSHARLVAPSLAIASGEAWIYATASRSRRRTTYRTELAAPLTHDTMRVYLGAFPAAQVARSLRTRPPHHECPRSRRV